MRAPLPPKDEQRLIACRLRQDTGEIDVAIDRIRHEIALVREYRTRLITDVVTGRLDVRSVEVHAVEGDDLADHPTDADDDAPEAEDALGVAEYA